MNELVTNLFQALKRKKMSITDFSEESGIPGDRIYKWRQKGTSPKADDQAVIKAWLEGKIVDKGQISEAAKEVIGEAGTDNATLLRILNNLSAAHLEISQANNRLSQNEQVILSKIPSTGSADQYTLAESVSTIQGLREFFEEIAAQVKSVPVLDIQQELNNKVIAAKKAVESKGIRAGAHK